MNLCRLSMTGMHKCAFLAVLLATTALTGAQQNPTYKQTNIISDGAVPALVTDPNFVDPWGISIGQDFWINTNVTGFDYVNDALGNVAFKVTIPPASGTGTGSPTGTVVTSTAPAGSFKLADGSPAVFLFCSLDGTISGWDVSLSGSGNIADIAVNNSSKNAVYTDIALVTNSTGTYLLATNFGAGASVEVYDTSFKASTLTGSFTDPNLPAGFAPYAVHTIGTTVYVDYMLRDTTTFQETLGAGTGIVDTYDVNGVLLKRAITGGNLNAPWGMALAPAGFGSYGGDLLVGNFGDGVINVYNPTTYDFIGQLMDSNGNAIANPGLWEIVFGQANPAVGDPNTLYFAAGINQEKDGLFGSISAVTVSPGPGTFALSSSTGTLTVTAAQTSASTILTLAPSNGFTGTVSLACSGLPSGATCSFSPASLSLTGTTSGSTTLTISTAAIYTPPPTGYMARQTTPLAPGGMGIAAAVMTPLAALVLFGVVKRRRKFLVLLPIAIVTVAIAMGMTGCGGSGSGGSSSKPTIPTGTSQVTITATSGAISKTTVVALTVQ